MFWGDRIGPPRVEGGFPYVLSFFLNKVCDCFNMVKLSWYMLSDGKHGTRNSEIYVPYAMHCIDDYLQLNVTVSSLDENTHPSIHPCLLYTSDAADE